MRIKKQRRWRWLVAIGVSLAGLPLLASPITGVETSYPTPCRTGDWGVFTGEIRGNLDGFWTAQVCHTPLSTNHEAKVLPGGGFQLHGVALGTSDDSQGAFLAGSISAGSEQDWSVAGRGVCRQTYALHSLSTTTGLVLDATLTHYGVLEGRHCRILFATFSGSWQKHSR